jgi:hypothetical protein
MSKRPKLRLRIRSIALVAFSVLLLTLATSTVAFAAATNNMR